MARCRHRLGRFVGLVSPIGTCPNHVNYWWLAATWSPCKASQPCKCTLLLLLAHAIAIFELLDTKHSLCFLPSCRLLHSGQPIGDVASRKGKFQDLQQQQPNYEKLYKYLNTAEWPVATYEKHYWQEIYS